MIGLLGPGQHDPLPGGRRTSTTWPNAEPTPIFRGAERRAQPKVLASAGWMRALVRYRRGDLRGAEAASRPAPDARPHRPARPGHLAGPAHPLAHRPRPGGGGRGPRSPSTRWTASSGGPCPRSPRSSAAAGSAPPPAGSPPPAPTSPRRWTGSGRADWLQPDEHDARVALVPVLLALGDTAGATALAGEALRSRPPRGHRARTRRRPARGRSRSRRRTGPRPPPPGRRRAHPVTKPALARGGPCRPRRCAAARRAAHRVP